MIGFAIFIIIMDIDFCYYSRTIEWSIVLLFQFLILILNLEY